MKLKKHIDIVDRTEINLSPLIDMMFLLLIFFIVTTAFIEEVGVTIERPKASLSKTLEKKSIMIGIQEDGTIIYGDNEIPFNNLRGFVARLLKEEKRPVILIASGKSLTERLIEVMDECKIAGANDISVATSKRDT